MPYQSGTSVNSSISVKMNRNIKNLPFFSNDVFHLLLFTKAILTERLAVTS